MLLTLVFGAALLTPASFSPSTLSTPLTSADSRPEMAALRRDLLAAHNRARAAVGAPPLSWSDEMAAHAAAWAGRLSTLGRLEHDQRLEDEGENLWMGTAGAFSPDAMVEDWNAERAAYAGQPIPDDESFHDFGHYTQVVWRGTTTVGCAIVSNGRFDVLDCRYGPAGNIIGERPY